MIRAAFISTLGLITTAHAHHGQDFLVTLDTNPIAPWEFISTTGFEATQYDTSDELSFTQSLIMGLPGNLSLGTTFRFADEGNNSWDSPSLTPSLQWTAPSVRLGSVKVNIAFAAGWEFAFRSEDEHSHNIALQDCSSLIGIPPLYAACQQINANAANHTHGEDSHSHDGIHRHGEDHGFARLILETHLTDQDRLAANLISVFSEESSPAYGYALAYRHAFNECFALGLEAIGDFDSHGEHLLYLTSTTFINHHLSLTLGAATGLNSHSPDLSFQSLLVWRF